MSDKTFGELIVVGPDAHLHIAEPESAKMAVYGSANYQKSLDAIQELVRATMVSSDKSMHEMMGASMREPINQLAKYKRWTDIFFTDWTLGETEDNKIPLDDVLGSAFISSTEGRPIYITPGVQQYTRPNFFEIKTGVQVRWSTVRTAGWPILQRLMERTADDAARRLDVKGRAILDAAIASVSGHRTSVSGGKLTKAGLDTVIKAAAQIGFPVTRAAINPARLMDMTDWQNGGTANYLPMFSGPDSTKEDVFRNLRVNFYGGITFIESISVPINSIYLSGDPASVGYHQDHGGAQTASDVDIDDGVDKHVSREDHAFYIGNACALRELFIQP